MASSPPPAGPPPTHRPASKDPSHIGFTPRPRVRWLAPSVLVRTLVEVLLSSTLTRYADRRDLQRLDSATPLDLTGPTEFWLDYVADIGDGFDAVTTVASQLARDTLELTDRGAPVSAPAGSLLVMGGDQAYPAASRDNYTDRLVGPYRSMLPWTDRPRRLVALPGNHDWYDGLGSFLRQFTQGRWIGGWHTEQARSYFAIRLPQGWWLWGVDIRLDADIDSAQLDYFRAIAENELAADDAIILCWPEPAWVAAGPERPEDPEAYAALDYFERSVIGDRARVRVSLSGDKHHYARYAGPGGEQLITAGAGGAYLAATHHLPTTLVLPPPQSRDPGKRPAVTYERRRENPSVQESRALRRDVLTSIYGNQGFWALPAVIYALLGFVIGRAVPVFAAGPPSADVPALLLAGVLLLVVWLGLAGYAGFGSRYSWRRRLLVGAGHTVAHLVLTVAAMTALRAAAAWWGLSPGWTLVLVLVGCGGVGALLGVLVFACYLLVADRLGPRGMNTNELFAAQARTDHRCFLRLHIAADGRLRIYPIMIEQPVCWEFADAPGLRPTDPWFRPADGTAPVAELIEDSITVEKGPGEARDTGR